MFDCSKDIRQFHDKEVTLPQSEQDEMRQRRNSNRDRLGNGLNREESPAPLEFVTQGSYAMKTMVCDPDNDYDIDDGVYFAIEDLVGDRGGEMTSLQARQMVRDAVDDGSFSQAPDVRRNCVRVYYKAGYHVDLPVYRRTVTSTFLGEEVSNELAAGVGWKRSDARDVTNWYEDALANSANGKQLRRLCRILKKFARSRASWRDGILSGFGITILVSECYKHNDREDLALYNTMFAIYLRLQIYLQIEHPVTPDEFITSGTDNAQTRSFRDKLADALGALEPLLELGCTRERALECWDKVFRTSFFSERVGNKKRESAVAPSVITSSALLSTTSRANDAISSAGGNRSA